MRKRARRFRRANSRGSPPALVAWVADADHVSLYGREEYRRAFAGALAKVLEAAAGLARAGRAPENPVLGKGAGAAR